VQTDAGDFARWQLYVRGERFDLALLARLARSFAVAYGRVRLT
jgi:hypothetical protein